MAHGLVTSGRTFRDRAARALDDPELQQALRNLDVRLGTAAEVERDHRALKDRAAAIRRETLADLDGWLDRLEGALVARGVTVHRCATPAEARGVVADVARRVGAHVVVKSKSMATEEIDLAEALEAVGFDAVETDLGEYVVQVAGERPSHIITPVIHKTLEQVATVLSEEAEEALPVDREALTDWVRTHLRQRFLDAGLGVTGANFAVAETGTLVIVTNEGNGRFCTALPRVHVAVVPVEKVIPRFADLATLLPVLTRSATGQRLSNYVSMISGPRRAGEHDGPEELHVVLLDHGRRRLIGTPYEAMLACIRCGACLNVCPVYRRVGGHAYDSVYPGPMGEVLTPLLSAGLSGRDLPAASTLCGACTEACPVEIPLADLIARLRADLRAPDPVAPGSRRPRLRRSGFGLWALVWSSPRGYRLSTTLARVVGAGRGPETAIRWRRRLPGVGGWTATRDLPVPARRRFRDQWSSRS
jgi:L-lactate dehydrogenase complex protein LldF